MPTQQRWAARHAERTMINGRWFAPNAHTHGSASTYSNWGCRCNPCTDAHRDFMQAKREMRMEERVEIDGRLTAPRAPQHASASTYVNWACRCIPCLTAYREYVGG